MTAANIGEKGRCIACKRDYQREFMRAKRQREQLGSGDMSPRSLRQAVNESKS